MELINIKDLHISFITNPLDFALKGIDLRIPEDTIMGLVGESGSGKTLTAYSILRLLHRNAVIRSGSIEYYSQGKQVDLLSLEEESIRQIRGREIAMIFQEAMAALNPIIRCGHQVSEVINAHHSYSKSLVREMVLESFNRVGLQDPERIFQSYPFELSGGQVQRVLIAQAIINKPRLIIADEPTTSLDVNMQRKVIELLKNIQNETACSILFISHDLGLIRELCDQVSVMHHGVIVESDSAANIYQHAQNPYTRSLMLCKPPLNQKVKKLLTIDDLAAHSSNKQRFEAIKQEEIASRMQWIRKQETILEVNNLQVDYHKQSILGWGKSKIFNAVSNVSFKLNSGEILGVVGESGSGKSSIGKSIVRLMKPTGGSIVYQGKDLAQISEYKLKPLRKEIQMVFQDPYSSLNPRQTIGQAIQEPMEIHRMFENPKQRKEKVEELLIAVGLKPEYFNRYPHQFSGGQRQRICIARALSVQPKLLVCDEPVSALDVSVQAQILNLFKELQEVFQLSYLFISHDLAGVHFMADRIIVLQNGRIVEEGWATQLINQPSNEYTKSLLAAVPKDL